MASNSALSFAASGSSRTSGGSWATAMRTSSGWRAVKSSVTTAPPLPPNTYAGASPKASSTLRASSDCWATLNGAFGSVSSLRELPRRS
jgi:hypothetical protein